MRQLNKTRIKIMPYVDIITRHIYSIKRLKKRMTNEKGLREFVEQIALYYLILFQGIKTLKSTIISFFTTIYPLTYNATGRQLQYLRPKQ